MAEINIDQGNYVTEGQVIVTLESESLETSVRNSALSLENSQINYEKAMDNLDNYTIKAPISGTVVTKNFKAGDKLDTSSAGMPLAVIYDLSSMKLEMNVDELDIHRISKGQEVNITADALEGNPMSAPSPMSASTAPPLAVSLPTPSRWKSPSLTKTCSLA